MGSLAEEGRILDRGGIGWHLVNSCSRWAHKKPTLLIVRFFPGVDKVLLHLRL
jgi:hypothetical protein